MKERPDDTTETGEGARPENGGAARRGRRHTPGGYYYDDATGYEVYDPEREADESAGDKDVGDTDNDAGDRDNKGGVDIADKDDKGADCKGAGKATDDPRGA